MTSKTALKIAHKRKRTDRLKELFDYVKKWVEAPLTVTEIVDRGRTGYVEVRCNKHWKFIKIKSKNQLMQDDLVLCKTCNKESDNMMHKIKKFESEMNKKYMIGVSKIRKHPAMKKFNITPEMIKSGLEDYYKNGGVVTRIGS